ncbi:MAG: glycosyltransferase family 4 protein [Candidatus Daviesbacteria bacterium]|nr:glycosyltransferase family 4 protein [Candidatus Daviesbacteria bacterium]
MMNILIFSWRGPEHPNAGGAEISTHEHAKGWVKAGHNVILFTSAFAGCKREEIKDGVKIIRQGKQILGVQWEAFKWYMFGNHPDFDLVIDQFHGIPFFTPIFVRARKLGFIHEVTKEVWKLNSWKRPLNLLPAILGTFFEPIIFKLFYTRISFMTVSDSTRQDLVEWGIPPNKITVVYNGLNAPKKIKKVKENKKTLIFLGALSKDKGIEDALKTFKLIDEIEKNKWQFWVVGKSDPRYLKELKIQSKNLGIQKKVVFWGFVSEDRKFDLLSRANIALNPSIREGWGLVVIEAAALGVPTVSYNAPGLRDSIINGRTGIICSVNNTKSMAEAILNLANNLDRYKKMSRNGILWSRKFSWEKSIKSSLKLIKNTYEI